jgi:hypothetical protein
MRQAKRHNENKSLNLIAHTKAKNTERLFVQRLKNFIEGKYLMCISDNYSVWCFDDDFVMAREQ